jgi:hypothetical protein
VRRQWKPDGRPPRRGAALRDQPGTVDALTVTTIVDNIVDVFLRDQGPAKRFTPADLGVTRTAARSTQEGEVPDAPRAEHRFSAGGSAFIRAAWND